MTATVEPRATAPEATGPSALTRADGLELLGEVHGSGYKEGAALVRRADGQMVQLGPLQYALLEACDGRCDTAHLARTMTERLGRVVEEPHVERLAQKLAEQGLLRGSEDNAPPRLNPLLALRWKVLVTNPAITKRLAQPFEGLFRPWVVAPVLLAFGVVFWFVLIHKGVASATAEAFHKPELLLLVFVLGIASAAFHELGHAAACRYGGATPGGMGMGIYMVWPAFYTDVTDAYRLPKRDRLRVDLGGLYFNAVVAVATLAVWLSLRVDALLLLVALQLLQMVKQLSPVIRADGYHILSDATGVPDLYAHIVPTLKRLLPGHRKQPSALTGRARLLVSAWVMVIVPVLLSLSISAVLLLPRLATTTWVSGSTIAGAIPGEAAHGHVLDALAGVVRLFALALPVLGSVLVAQRIVRRTAGTARSWSAGRPARRVALAAATVLVMCGLAWAWWPSGQYQPVRAGDGGTIQGIGRLVSSPQNVARPRVGAAAVNLTPGKHLAVAMIPVGGATKQHPAFFMVRGGDGQKPVMLVSPKAPDPGPVKTGSSATGTGTTVSPASSSTPIAPVPTQPSSPSTTTTTPVTAFPFTLPDAPGPHGTQALAVNTTDGGVKYDVVYSVVTVTDGATVDESNEAYALANCNACTTVAVSFQVVLIVGQSNVIVPTNLAEALNVNCPACVTTAIADQIVVTLSADPPKQLVQRLNDDLKQLDAIKQLGSSGSPDEVAQEVAAIQDDIETELKDSGLMTNPPDDSTTTGTTTTGTTTTGTSTTGTSTTSTGTGTTTTGTSTTGTSTTGTSTTGTTTTGTSTTGTTTTDTSTTPTSTDTGTTTTTTTGTSTGTSTSASP